jgi:cell division protein ZapA
MAHVSVTINGRQYRMSCDDGQEHHVARLAHDLDQRIMNLRVTFGEIGDARLTIMAALMLVDELSEQRQRLHRIETELTGLQRARRRSRPRDGHRGGYRSGPRLHRRADRKGRAPDRAGGRHPAGSDRVRAPSAGVPVRLQRIVGVVSSGLREANPGTSAVPQFSLKDGAENDSHASRKMQTR